MHLTDVDALLQDTVTDSISPGICCRPGCDYTTAVEAGQDQGWRKGCGTATAWSALILAERI